MESKPKTLEERVRNLRGIYEKLDGICKYVPKEYADQIKQVILGDQDLKKLLKGMEDCREPRVLLIGRTGFGKSSLVNALCGEYVAKVSDVESCTTGIQRYTCGLSDGASMEILDTRGISESIPVSEGNAETEILKQIKNFDPDIALLVLSCVSRDGMGADVAFLKEIRKACYANNAVELPIVVAINKADAVTPARESLPYSPQKLQNIQKIQRSITRLFEKSGIQVAAILPVSSVIDWQDETGVEYHTADELNQLDKSEQAQLRISYDGRYNMTPLKEALENSIADANASMGMRMVFHLSTMLEKIANNLVNIYSGIGSLVVGVSLPVTDYVVLVSIEALMVTNIMALSGRDVSLDSAKEFIASMTGTATTGLAFRQVAHVAVKLIPVGGTLISATIAAGGIKTIGNAAVDYFIKERDFKEVRREFQRNSRVQKWKAKGSDLIKQASTLFKKEKS